MLEGSLRFLIKPGVVAAWESRTIIIIALQEGSSTCVRDIETGEAFNIPSEDLKGILEIGHVETNESRWSLIRDSTRVEWKQARWRERVRRKCVSRDGSPTEGIEFACKSLGLSRRTIYRLPANYRDAAQTTTLIQKHCGTLPASRRLTATRGANAMRYVDFHSRCPFHPQLMSN